MIDQYTINIPEIFLGVHGFLSLTVSVLAPAMLVGLFFLSG